MGIQDIRIEIDKILNSLPEEELKSVLDYLKEVNKLTIKELSLTHNLGKILKEDTNLLKRLAE